MQINVVSHPISLEKEVSVARPSCQCRGAKIEHIVGVVKKVIKNNTGYWYYLDVGKGSGVTVKADWVTSVKD